jgi:hypothetical protein
MAPTNITASSMATIVSATPLRLATAFVLVRLVTAGAFTRLEAVTDS